MNPDVSAVLNDVSSNVPADAPKPATGLASTGPFAPSLETLFAKYVRPYFDMTLEQVRGFGMDTSFLDAAREMLDDMDTTDDTRMTFVNTWDECMCLRVHTQDDTDASLYRVIHDAAEQYRVRVKKNPNATEQDKSEAADKCLGAAHTVAHVDNWLVSMLNVKEILQADEFHTGHATTHCLWWDKMNAKVQAIVIKARGGEHIERAMRTVPLDAPASPIATAQGIQSVLEGGSEQPDFGALIQSMVSSITQVTQGADTGEELDMKRVMSMLGETDGPAGTLFKQLNDSGAMDMVLESAAGGNMDLAGLSGALFQGLEQPRGGD